LGRDVSTWSASQPIPSQSSSAMISICYSMRCRMAFCRAFRSMRFTHQAWPGLDQFVNKPFGTQDRIVAIQASSNLVVVVSFYGPAPAFCNGANDSVLNAAIFHQPAPCCAGGSAIGLSATDAYGQSRSQC